MVGYKKQKICKECHLEFTATNPAQVYCKRDHYRNCPICGKSYLVKRSNLPDPPRACRGECAKEARRRTNLARYGVEDSGNMESSLEKRRQTCLERYGVDNSAKCSDFKAKAEESNLKKYGTRWATQNEQQKAKQRATWDAKTDEELEELSEKRKKTNLERYGVEWTSQLPGHKEHVQAVIEERYGPEGLKSEVVKARKRKTYLEHYGVDHPFKSNDVIEKQKARLLQEYGVTNIRHIPGVEEKIAATNQERYGAKTYLTSEILQRSIMRDGEKYDEYIQFKDDPETYIRANFTEPPTVYEVALRLGVTSTSIYAWLDKYDCRDLVKFSGSTYEAQVLGYLRNLKPGIVIEHNNKTIIKPYELDFYLPEYRIAIEVNPTETHNSTFVDPWGGDPKPYKYHQEKSLRCRDAGIFLFHIFGYEWTNKREVVESMLASLLNETQTRYYARNTYVVELTSEECSKFLFENHRQNYVFAKIRLGLKLKNTNELVAVMTFNHPRHTLGQTTVDQSSHWELSRFCNKRNTTVVGGASKLFKYFLRKYNPEKVISFSDIAHTRGSLYSLLGFTAVSESDPSYVWVNTLNDQYYSRVACQKKNILNLFKGEDLDLSKTEKQLMSEHGYAQVFDAGVIRWEWTSFNLQ